MDLKKDLLVSLDFCDTCGFPFVVQTLHDLSIYSFNDLILIKFNIFEQQCS